jgi:hypothetical protein
MPANSDTSSGSGDIEYRSINMANRFFANNSNRGTTTPPDCGPHEVYDEANALYGPILLVADIMVSTGRLVRSLGLIVLLGGRQARARPNLPITKQAHLAGLAERGAFVPRFFINSYFPDCCPRWTPFPGIRNTLPSCQIKRVASYYILTNLIPVLLITLVAFVVFFMPQSELGDRMSE